MVKANQRSILFLSSILMLSLLLFSSMAESHIFRVQKRAAVGSPKAPECDEVFGARSGDTCPAITQSFNLTTEFFTSMNPNLNCDALFVGQWLCTAGSAN